MKRNRWLSSATVGTQDDGDTLEDAIDDEVITQRAFESNGGDHSELCLAADNTDKRFNDRRKAFRVDCACMGGPVSDKCAHVIRSDAWDRLHDDMIAKVGRASPVVSATNQRCAL